MSELIDLRRADQERDIESRDSVILSGSDYLRLSSEHALYRITLVKISQMGGSIKLARLARRALTNASHDRLRKQSEAK